MAQENNGQLATAQENQDPIAAALNATNKDRAALDALLGPLFKHLWTDFLDILFEVFPHNPGDHSENERAYARYRHRVLNIGNRKVREVPNITRDFILYQVFKREVLLHQKIKGQGPWNLPPGVKMPSERNNNAANRQ